MIKGTNGSNVSGTSGGSIIQRTPMSTYLTSGKLIGCYSMRVIVSGYTGPVAKIARSYDNAQGDLYTDSTQSYLIIGPYNYITWISDFGGSTAYIRMLYDQSGRGNHIDGALLTKPTVVPVNNKYVINFPTATSSSNNAGLRLPFYFNPSTILCHWYNVNTNFGTIVSSNTGDLEVRFGANAQVLDGGLNSNDWYYSSGGTKLAYNNGVNITATSSGNNILVGAWNVLSASTSSPATFNLNTIGVDGYSYTRSMSGYMSEIIFLNTSLNATEMQDYYNNRFF